MSLYTHTTRAVGLILTAAIYNADHVNHADSQTALLTVGYSPDVATMRTVTSPGGVGTESLAASVAAEIARLRYVIQDISGGAQWYSQPSLINVCSPRYGADPTGTGDSTAAIQAALTAAAVTGAVVYFPPGIYRCTDALTLVSNNHLVGCGKGVSILYWDDDDYNDTGAVVAATGTFGAENLVTGDVGRGATTVAVTDGTAFSAGGYGVLRSHDHFNDLVAVVNPIADDITAGNTPYFKGEIIRVTSVAANTLNLSSPTLDSYTVATGQASVYPMTPVTNISIVGLTIRREAQSAAARQGIAISQAVNVTLRDVAVEYGTERGFVLDNVVNFVCDNCSAEDSFYTGTATSYGYSVLDASRDGRITNCYARNFRHGISMGRGGALTGGVPRFITADGNSLDQGYAVISAAVMDTHTTAEFITYSHNILHGGKDYAIQMLSSRSSVVANVSYGEGGFTSINSFNTGNVITGNVFNVIGARALSGIRFLGQHAMISNNVVNCLDGTARNAIVVLHVDNDTALINVDVTGNKVNHTVAITGAGPAITLYGVQGGKLSDNTAYWQASTAGAAFLLTDRGTAVCDNVDCYNNKATDVQGAATMTYGLQVGANSTNIRHGGNSGKNATAADVSVPAATMATNIVGKPEVKVGGSTVIGAGVGSVCMSNGNAATNTVWIPFTYNGTTYYLPGFTTNTP